MFLGCLCVHPHYHDILEIVWGNFTKIYRFGARGTKMN